MDFQRSVDLLRTMGKLIISGAFILYIVRFAGGFGEGVILILAFILGGVLGCVRLSPILVFFITLLACAAMVYTGII